MLFPASVSDFYLNGWLGKPQIMDTNAIKPYYLATYNPNYVYRMPENCVLMINVFWGSEHPLDASHGSKSSRKGNGLSKFGNCGSCGSGGNRLAAVYFCRCKPFTEAWTHVHVIYRCHICYLGCCLFLLDFLSCRRTRVLALWMSSSTTIICQTCQKKKKRARSDVLEVLLGKIRPNVSPSESYIWWPLRRYQIIRVKRTTKWHVILIYYCESFVLIVSRRRFNSQLP